MSAPIQPAEQRVENRGGSLPFAGAEEAFSALREKVLVQAAADAQKRREEMQRRTKPGRSAGLAGTRRSWLGLETSYHRFLDIVREILFRENCWTLRAPFKDGSKKNFRTAEWISRSGTTHNLYTHISESKPADGTLHLGAAAGKVLNVMLAQGDGDIGGISEVHGSISVILDELPSLVNRVRVEVDFEAVGAIELRPRQGWAYGEASSRLLLYGAMGELINRRWTFASYFSSVVSGIFTVREKFTIRTPLYSVQPGSFLIVYAAADLSASREGDGYAAVNFVPGMDKYFDLGGINYVARDAGRPVRVREIRIYTRL
jgi:hypothetical protein